MTEIIENQEVTEETVETTEVVEDKAEEAEVVTEKVEIKKQDLRSHALAVAARKERIIRGKEADLRGREEKAKLYEDAIKSKNPLELLSSAGFSMDDLIEYQLSGKIKEPSADDRVLALEKRWQTQEKQNLETEYLANQEQANKELKQYSNQLAQYIDTSGKYPIVQKCNAQGAVFNRIVEIFNETGKLLSNDEAAQEIESYLSNLAAIANELISDQAKQSDEPDLELKIEGLAPRNKKPISTLTNKLTAPASGDSQDFSEEEREQRAIDMLRKLKTK